jgi:hypothetical protein
MNRLRLLEYWDRGFESHSRHGCMCIYSVCVVLCVSSGLATGWSPLQRVLPTVYGLRNWKGGQGPQGLQSPRQCQKRPDLVKPSIRLLRNEMMQTPFASGCNRPCAQWFVTEGTFKLRLSRDIKLRLSRDNVPCVGYLTTLSVQGITSVG